MNDSRMERDPLGELLVVLLLLGQDPAVNLGMQCLYPTIEHFGKTGELRDIHYLNATIPHLLGGATGRKDIHSHIL